MLQIVFLIIKSAFMNYFECLSQLKIFLTLLIIEISKLKLIIINAVINILYKKNRFFVEHRSLKFLIIKDKVKYKLHCNN